MERNQNIHPILIASRGRKEREGHQLEMEKIQGSINFEHQIGANYPILSTPIEKFNILANIETKIDQTGKYIQKD